MADGEDEPLVQSEELGELPDNEAEEQVQEEAEVQAEAEAGEEIVFVDGAAPAPGDESSTIRQMREEFRRLQKENAELRKSSAPQRIEVGPKPTLASCEYDEERYEAELDEWKTREAAVKRQQASAEEQNRQVREQFEKDQQAYREKRAKLTFADAEEVEQVALARLDEIQQATIVSVAEDAAKVLYALGRHPGKLAELSQIQNPLKLAAAVVRFERSFQIMPRRQVTEPEEVATGSASMGGRGTDKELERLEKKAAQTNDRSEVVAYKRRLKTQAA